MKSTGRIYRRLVGLMASLRANSLALLAATVLVVSSLLYALIARAAIIDGDRQVGDATPAKLTPHSKEQDRLKEQPLETGVNSTALDAQSSSPDSKIGVSINGTPIPIPENNSINMTVPNSSGSGDVHVSIESTSSTDNDESGSSSSISIQSTTNTKQEH